MKFIEKTKEFVKRHKTKIVTGAVVVLGVVAGAVGVTLLNKQPMNDEVLGIEPSGDVLELEPAVETETTDEQTTTENV